MLGGTSAAAETLTALAVEKVIPFEVTYSHLENYDTRLLFASDALWTVVHPNLVRIDPKSYGQTNIELPGVLGPVRPLAFGEGAIWIADTGSNTIFKVDAANDRVALKMKASLLSVQSPIAVGAGSLWMVTAEHAERVVTRFDAMTGEVQAQIELPDVGSGVAFDGGSVWAAGRNEIYRIDPAANAVVASTPICDRPSTLAAGEGSIWVHCRNDGIVNRIDSATGVVTGSLDVGVKGPGMVDLTTGGGHLWLASLVIRLIEIDPATVELRKAFESDLHTEANVAYGDNSLWLLRIRPKGEILRLSAPD
ncbi:MAG: hypothetical protein KDK07_06615 [Bauldia sp.]|nr:hypothetical protein [Bauldia sp.]